MIVSPAFAHNTFGDHCVYVKCWEFINAIFYVTFVNQVCLFEVLVSALLYSQLLYNIFVDLYLFASGVLGGLYVTCICTTLNCLHFV